MMKFRTCLLAFGVSAVLSGAALAQGMNYRGACEGRASVMFATPRVSGPVYPPAARTRREEGDTVLKIVVGKGGVAAKASLLASSGSPRLDNSALGWVRRHWRGAADCGPGATTQLTVAWRLVAPRPALGHTVP
jgi:TonB family protein